MGAVYVLLYPRIADGILGDAYSCDPRYFVGVDRRNGHRTVRSVDRVDERYFVFGVAGKALWHAQSDPHHHVLRRGRHDFPQRRPVVHLASDVRVWSDGLWRQLWLSGSGD
ncbi:hypothetical protein D3C76_1516420 [compost metagenome]